MINLPVNDFTVVSGNGDGQIPEIDLIHCADQNQLKLKCSEGAQPGDGMFWALRYDLSTQNMIKTETNYEISFELSFSNSDYKGSVLVRAFNGEQVIQFEANHDGTYGLQMSKPLNSSDFYLDILACEWTSLYLQENQELVISDFVLKPKEEQSWQNKDGSNYVISDNCSLFGQLQKIQPGKYTLLSANQDLQVDLTLAKYDHIATKYYCDVTSHFYLQSEKPIKAHIRFSDSHDKTSETYEINLPAGRWPIALSLRSQPSRDYKFMLSFKPGALIDIELERIDETRVPFQSGPRLRPKNSNKQVLTAYLSHHRNGSSWLYSIINTLGAITDKRINIAHYLNEDYDKISETLAKNGTDLLIDRNIDLGNYDHSFIKGIHVIRDPRDMLVSSYFSHLKSHPDQGWPELTRHRALTQKLSQENGLLEEISFCNDFFEHMYSVKRHEHKHDIKTVKFENLINNQFEMFKDILLHLEIDLSNHQEKTLHTILEQHSFTKMSCGRKAGDVNSDHHYRKGIVGDWKNFFSAPVKEMFKVKHQKLLELYEYETDESW